MSYGSETCPHCQGEVKVYVDGDGTASGWCPHCRKSYTFLPRRWKPRIPDEGAFYEVIVDEWTDILEKVEEWTDGNGKPHRLRHWKEISRTLGQSIAIYTNLEQARKRCEEIRAEAKAKTTETTEYSVVANIKRWNHDRTDWEWWRPEWAEQEGTA
jgi:hypothetical protein